MMRTLIAGFGNELRGDDGFGVAVIHRLEERPPEGADLIEVGTAGLRMAQQLLSGYDRLIVVDAMARGGKAGTLYVLQVESVEKAAEVDLHLAVPSRALSVAQALGALPKQVFLVGCEPFQVDELSTTLTPAVRAAVEGAIHEIQVLLAARAA
jgi:hydrogenase maturation protease